MPRHACRHTPTNCLTCTGCRHARRGCPTHARPLTVRGRTQRWWRLPVRQPRHGGKQGAWEGTFTPSLLHARSQARGSQPGGRVSAPARAGAGWRARTEEEALVALARGAALDRALVLLARGPVRRVVLRRLGQADAGVARAAAPRVFCRAARLAAGGRVRRSPGRRSIRLHRDAHAVPRAPRQAAHARRAPSHSAWEACAALANTVVARSQNTQAYDSTAGLPNRSRHCLRESQGSCCWQQAAPVCRSAGAPANRSRG